MAVKLNERLKSCSLPEILLIVCVVFLGLGAYLGGWAVSVGHGFFVLFLVCLLVVLNKGQLHVETALNFRQKKVKLSGSAICLIVFLCCCLISVLVNYSSYERPFKDLKKLRYYLFPLLVIVVPVAFRFAYRHRKRLLRYFGLAMMFSLVLATVSGMIGYFSGFNPLTWSAPLDPGRMGGIYGLVMTYGYSIALALLLLIGVLLDGEKIFSSVSWKGNRNLMSAIVLGVVVLGAIGLYFSFCRGAILGLAIGGVCLLVARRAWKLLFGGGAAAMLLALFLISSNSHLFESRSASTSERTAQWRASFLIFLDHPFLGIGYRQLEKRIDVFKVAYHLPKDRLVENDGLYEMEWYRSHAHNNYIEAFAATGALGGLAFVGFCGFWLRETWNSERGRKLFFPVAVSFIVSGFFENTFYDGEVLSFIMSLYVISQMVVYSDAEEIVLGNPKPT